jgi:hypothetical protein
MALQQLLSFRESYWPHHFPIEAWYYEYEASGPPRALRTRRITTPEALLAFQEELTTHEQQQEWSFLAYYEALVLQ